MIASFDSAEWHNAVAALIRGGDLHALCAALDDVVARAVDHEGTCLLAFHRDSPPAVLHHTIDAAGARHYLDRYIAGPYLLDPLYQLALASDRPMMIRFRDTMPDRFRSTEYYRQYCDQTHLLDEMDFVLNVDPKTTVVLVIGKRQRRFNRSELRRLASIESLIQAAIRKTWDSYSESSPDQSDDRFDHRLKRCFEQFSAGLLTAREREITQLMLRGHSVKSAAMELDIAPGTVMVHKRNLFNKLGISSQNELYSLFIDELSRS